MRVDLILSGCSIATLDVDQEVCMRWISVISITDNKKPYIELRHRPEETELKNGDAGETEMYISGGIAQIFKDYIETNRIDVLTDNGREPF